MKCDICKAEIEVNFLNKIMGTYVKDKKGKVKVICPKCQRQLQNKENILKKL